MSNERCTIKFPPWYDFFLLSTMNPTMQTKNGVYWCSLEICMTSDNYHSLDQDNRTIGLPSRQTSCSIDETNNEWGYVTLRWRY
jgi:hypothetical protein